MAQGVEGRLWVAGSDDARSSGKGQDGVTDCAFGIRLSDEALDEWLPNRAAAIRSNGGDGGVDPVDAQSRSMRLGVAAASSVGDGGGEDGGEDDVGAVTSEVSGVNAPIRVHSLITAATRRRHVLAIVGITAPIKNVTSADHSLTSSAPLSPVAMTGHTQATKTKSTTSRAPQYMQCRYAETCVAVSPLPTTTARMKAVMYPNPNSVCGAPTPGATCSIVSSPFATVGRASNMVRDTNPQLCP